MTLKQRRNLAKLNLQDPNLQFLFKVFAYLGLASALPLLWLVMSHSQTIM